MKKILIVGLIIVTAFIGVRVKQAMDLAEYAAINGCSWSATGTHYGDNRDWVCK